MKIYTKKGDKGYTSLIGGVKVSKNNQRIQAYGTVDELNAFTGLLCDHLNNKSLKDVLQIIQDRLFVIGSLLASHPEKSNMKLPLIKQTDIDFLEKEIDKMESELEPLTNFILPGGHPAVSYCHVARCVCRRAEREAVNLSDIEVVAETIVPYLNRLSDYFFVLARKTAKDLKVAEKKWTPTK